MDDANNTINFNRILWYAQRAKLVYESEADIRQQLPETCAFVLLPVINVQYFIENVPSEGAQLVSVRGTANLTNAREDVEFVKARDARLGIYVHRGFD